MPPEICRGEKRRVLIHGVTWNTLYQGFHIAISFGAMLVLVRVIPPSEYGRASAAVGWLLLMGSFGCAQFMNHALQLPEDQEPNWSLHWSAGLYIQGMLCIVSQLVAALCWHVSAYWPLAPLLHLAGIGVLLDCSNRLRGTMLRRQMNFRRLRIVQATGTLAGITVTLAFGLRGHGAYAIVLGQNIALGLPFSVDLLFFERWRPKPGWWRWPDWSAYRPAIQFGLQQVASSLLNTLRAAAETAVLPVTLGFRAMGLWNRAQSLYSTSFGRLQNIGVEAVYPLLPRYAAETERYRTYATLFCQAVLWVAFAGVAFLGVSGPILSRVVYGTKWVAADPVIWPGALAGLGLAAFIAGSSALLAANRLRTCFSLDMLSASFLVPIMAVTWLGGGLVMYAWAVAAAQILVGIIALSKAAPLLKPNWLHEVVLPPLVSSIAACFVVWFLEKNLWATSLAGRLMLTSAAYVFIFVLVIRVMFPQTLTKLLRYLPGGLHVSRVFFIPVVIPLPAPEPSQ
jgi:O-antigen/teichoic acid export membrane protein